MKSDTFNGSNREKFNVDIAILAQNDDYFAPKSIFGIGSN